MLLPNIIGRYFAAMESKLKKLTLDSRIPAAHPKAERKSKAPVVDSWEEEDLSDSDSGPEDASNADQSSIPNAPPPTPILPSHRPTWDNSRGFPSDRPQAARDRDEGRRPEKSTATASRMIAAGLGVKAPKKTEEQRAYDRVAKEQELKRRNREKEAVTKEKEEAERAKNAVWDN